MAIISSASGSVLITSGALSSNYSGSVAYGPKQVSDGLVLYVDAANPLSYSGSGNIWNDLTKNGYNGALSGSVAVVPSWDSTHQGRIHVKASSSYAIPGTNISTPMSSSFINFGKILDDVFVGTGSQAGISQAGGGTVATGTSPKFTINLWFEIDYSKQIVQSAYTGLTTRDWYSIRNFPMLVAKYADNSVIEGGAGWSGDNLGTNRHFYIGLFPSASQPGAWSKVTDIPLPNAVTNPYYIRAEFSENPQPTNPGLRRPLTLSNTSYAVPDKQPINVCISFDYSLPANVGGRTKLYINGYQIVGSAVSTAGNNGNYIGSNSALSLGAWIGATDRILEGAVNGPTPVQAGGTAFQSDTYFHIFQVYDRALTPQEIEQNYFAHRYRFRPWGIL
jgi:hypothetical protein